jgi:DNA gyrase subunit B
VAQPPLYKVQQKNRRNQKPRYVQTHQEMMGELLGLGLDGSELRFRGRQGTAAGNGDGRVISGDQLAALATLMESLEESLLALERRGIELRTIARHVTGDGLLPRFRVFLGTQEHWFGTKVELDAFLTAEQRKAGRELSVADVAPHATDSAKGVKEPGAGAVSPAETSAPVLHVTDLHEMRGINEGLKRLRGEFQLSLEDLLAAGVENAEQVYPYELEHDANVKRLTSLRQLVQSLRDIGGRGLTYTRFKGLGEMNADELFETSMDPENRILKQVALEDAAAAEEIFRVLMGDHVEPRREFIEKHALEVADLDI